MSAANSTQEHPFENPLYRYAVGISGAAILVFIAVFYLEGLLRYLVLGLAVIDAVLVPKILEKTIEAAE
ncbi:hypothetical protein [Natronosalvus vescus]|uniref:hypothetical protein n=1 Tax=Natronosalvus vescus TaxID=2953881 RepID=UPI00209122CC|nr:hypothetical protein [Natronosalvus vescus]